MEAMYDDDEKALPPPPMTDCGYVRTLASKEDVLKLHDLLAAHPGAWVTFRRDLELHFDGNYSNHVTPEAIYGMSTDYTMRKAAEYLKLSKVKQMNSYFHAVGYTRRPTAVVFRPAGRVVSTMAYSREDFLNDLDRLSAYVKERYPEVPSSVVEGWRPKRVYDDYMHAQALFWMTEKTADRIVGAEMFGDFYHHPDKPRVWRELMNELGVVAFEDRNNFMTGDCQEQIAVFDPASVEILAAFENPAAAPPDAERDEEVEFGISRRF